MSDRKASYKTPPAAVRNTVSSQEQRRHKALEEQKRRRAERIDSSRQLDFFADLNLGPSDDEADLDSTQEGPSIPHDGIAQFASMLPPSSAVVPPALTEPGVSQQQSNEAQKSGKKRGKNKRKGKAGLTSAPQSKRKPNQWADKCMYAELLEMTDAYNEADMEHDGIPEDLETGWVAVTPVPMGKRCLAVTHQSSGIAGVVSNTTLRSRVLGKALMKPFPSSLPPQTILDCILDDNWRDNGILHVLDVLQWKAQDVTECETPFRFWWRDTRLSELPPSPPPPNALAQANPYNSPSSYQFPYPSSFLPVPYHTDTTLPHLLNTLIPLTRLPRFVPVSTPISMSPTDTGPMDLDGHTPLLVELRSVQAEIKPDGLLLYVAQATYEPGTSPLSSWIPLKSYDPEVNKTEGDVEIAVPTESPLEVFERLVRRRLEQQKGSAANSMDM